MSLILFCSSSLCTQMVAGWRDYNGEKNGFSKGRFYSYFRVIQWVIWRSFKNHTQIHKFINDRLTKLFIASPERFYDLRIFIINTTIQKEPTLSFCFLISNWTKKKRKKNHLQLIGLLRIFLHSVELIIILRRITLNIITIISTKSLTEHLLAFCAISYVSTKNSNSINLLFHKKSLLVVPTN